MRWQRYEIKMKNDVGWVKNFWVVLFFRLVWDVRIVVLRRGIVLMEPFSESRILLHSLIGLQIPALFAICASG